MKIKWDDERDVLSPVHVQKALGKCSLSVITVRVVNIIMVVNITHCSRKSQNEWNVVDGLGFSEPSVK